jgi:hypothetical protein
VQRTLGVGAKNNRGDEAGVGGNGDGDVRDIVLADERVEPRRVGLGVSDGRRRKS